MRQYQSAALGRCLVRFFQNYLPTLRGMSLNTIRSYRDAMVLLLQFAAKDTGRPVEALEITNFTADLVGRFLMFLETERRNSIVTRNARLAAIHTFARFLIAECPEHMEGLQQVLGLPFKSGAREAPIEYLEKGEIEAVLTSIDRSTPLGQRDYAMFPLMFNTGARVQEILSLQVRDFRLEPPYQVRLLGKGNKARLCPIWPRTAKLLEALIKKQYAAVENPAGQPVFVNRQGAALTRFGVRYLLRKYVAAGAKGSPALTGKSIHPHSVKGRKHVRFCLACVNRPHLSAITPKSLSALTVKSVSAIAPKSLSAIPSKSLSAMTPKSLSAFERITQIWTLVLKGDKSRTMNGAIFRKDDVWHYGETHFKNGKQLNVITSTCSVRDADDEPKTTASNQN